MVGAIAMAAALARMVTVTCPHCGHKKAVDRAPKHHRVCPKCHKQFADPLARRRK
jgi:transposase-like protein